MEGQLKNGTILTSESGNKYEVVSLLGAGGQGEVYDVKCGGNHLKIPLFLQCHPVALPTSSAQINPSIAARYSTL